MEQLDSNQEAFAANSLPMDSLLHEQRQLSEQLEILTAQRRDVASAQAQVEQAASSLEDRIRQLAKEEAQIQQRKKDIETEARSIGEQRTGFLTQIRQMDQQAHRIEAALTDLESKRIAAEKTQAQSLPAPAVAEHDLVQTEGLPAGAPTVDGQPSSALPAELENQSEQRIKPRVAVAVDVAMHTDHNFYMGLTENLSEGGLFMATYDDVPVGTEVELSIQLPDRPAIKARGVVRWVRQYSRFTSDVAPGVGLELLNMSTADEKNVRSFLAERDPLYFENEW